MSYEVASAQYAWGVALNEVAEASKELAFAVLEHADKKHRATLATNETIVDARLPLSARLRVQNAKQAEQHAKIRYYALLAKQKGE